MIPTKIVIRAVKTLARGRSVLIVDPDASNTHTTFGGPSHWLDGDRIYFRNGDGSDLREICPQVIFCEDSLKNGLSYLKVSAEEIIYYNGGGSDV